jgi:hypothetical protein
MKGKGEVLSGISSSVIAKIVKGEYISNYEKDRIPRFNNIFILL